MSHAVIAPTTTVSDREWTLDDLEFLPRGERCEILDGVLYMPPLPEWSHGTCATNLFRFLDRWVSDDGLGHVRQAGVGIYRDRWNYLDPDVVVYRHHHVPAEESLPMGAALAVEVLSPANRRSSYRPKREAFLVERGVPEHWYVDPVKRTLEVLRLEVGAYKLWRVFSNEEIVSSPEFPGLEFPLPTLWQRAN